jgi:hypothetical protein
MSPIKIEAGKKYVDATGDIVGPMIVTDYSPNYPFMTPEGYEYTGDGFFHESKVPSGFDLVQEYVPAVGEDPAADVAELERSKLKIEVLLTERNALLEALENFITNETLEDLDRLANSTTLGPDVPKKAQDQLKARAAIGMVLRRSE